MRREWIIFVCGVVIFFLPLLGFPQSFDNTVFILIGLLLVILALRNIRKEYVRELYEQEKSPR
ncbi:MAG TPA: hypothetical protein VJK09_03275 [Candidatus Paceibacterota bacterium]